MKAAATTRIDRWLVLVVRMARRGIVLRLLTALLSTLSLLPLSVVLPPSAGLTSRADAGPGYLDSTYGSNGWVAVDVAECGEGYCAVVVQPDGKSVVAAGGILARFNADGSLDTSFGAGGTTRIGSGSLANAVALQADGRIVTAGYVPSGDGAGGELALARFTPDGTPDAAFGSGGKVVTFPGGRPVDYEKPGFAIQTDGKILVTGYSHNGSNSDFAILRYETSGALDMSFGAGGRVTTDFGMGNEWAGSLAVDRDGRIVAAGDTGGSPRAFALARYEPDGKLDATFGVGGKVTAGVGVLKSVAVQADGKPVAAGYTWLGFQVVRLTANGTLDSSFGTGGEIVSYFPGNISTGEGLVLQPDGKIVIAGQ